MQRYGVQNLAPAENKMFAMKPDLAILLVLWTLVFAVGALGARLALVGKRRE